MANETADRLTGQLMHLPNIIGNLGLNIARAQVALDENYLSGVERLMVLIKGTLGTETLQAQAAAAAVKVVQMEARLAAATADVAEKKAALDTATDAQRAAATEEHEAAVEARDEVAGELAAAVKARDSFGPAAGVMVSLFRSLAPSRYQFTQTTLDFSADLAETKDTSFELGLGVGLQAVTLNAAYASSFGYDYRAAARVKTVLNAIPADRTLVDTLLSNADKIGDLTLPERSVASDKLIDRTAEIYQSLTKEDPALPATDTEDDGDPSDGE